MANFSARPPLTSLKKSVLDTIRGLVSKSVYKAIDIIMSPCCEITSEAVISCGDSGYNITLTYTPKPVYLGKGTLLVFVNNILVTSVAYDDSGTLQLNNVSISGAPGDPVVIRSSFLMSTSNAPYNSYFIPVGIFQLSDTSTTLPTCVF